MSETRKLAAILAADVVGFSRLASADEDRTLARLRTLRSDLIDPTVDVHHGRVIKRMGDGFLVEFRSVVDAVRCAIELQNSMVERNAGLAPERRIEFRIGVHLGDVVEEADGDLMGDGVNIASRLEGIARPGAVCLSEDAYRQVRARFDLAISDLGHTQLKNIVEPVRVYSLEVGAPAQPKTAAQAPPLAPVKPPPPLTPAKPSIAVLAFNNMSGDAEQEYFSDGISEDIITDLSMLNELHVVARNSSFAYKKAAPPIPDVAKALGVRYVLEGSVRKAGNRVRVTAQLIDSTSGGHIWANRFDRELNDIFAIQDELTKEIVSALKLKLTLGESDRLAQKRDVNVEAYEFFLRGREHAWRATRSGNIAARDLLERAIAIDPDYVAAHAAIAMTHVIDYANGFSSDPEQSLKMGRELAERVVAMAENDPAGHFVLGAAYMWGKELDRAQEEASRAMTLAPNSADGLRMTAHIQIFSGNPAGAIENLEAYMKQDPHYPGITLQLVADARFALGQYELAIEAIQKRLAQNSESETAHALLASCYGQLGRPEECQKSWAQALRINPEFSMQRRRRVLPFRNIADFDKRIEGLRKGGVAV
jgi:TolB-like protein/class 3 adenylate cyclase/Flp pilus assembly protein TadD